MKYGFIKVAAAVPSVKVADCQYNVKEIEKLIIQAGIKRVVYTRSYRLHDGVALLQRAGIIVEHLPEL